MELFTHGGDTYLKENMIDFSANINPLGMPVSVQKALVESVKQYSSYPDPGCRQLIKQIAAYEQLDEKRIICGNGAADLIFRLVLALRPQRALLLAPTFSEYEKALRVTGSSIQYEQLNAEENFRLTKRVLEKLTKEIDFFILCNPNNPTGQLVAPELLEQILQRCQENDIYLLVDECFLDFVQEKEYYQTQKYLNRGENQRVMILKAFTKLYAMAGLRLGYLLCGQEELVEKLQDCAQAWSVSTPAQIAGIAALGEVEYRRKTIEYITTEREYLYNNIATQGIRVYPSMTNFLLLQSDIPLEEELKKEKILVRSCENFRGLDSSFYRIAVRTAKENKQLIQALERIRRNG